MRDLEAEDEDEDESRNNTKHHHNHDTRRNGRTIKESDASQKQVSPTQPPQRQQQKPLKHVPQPRDYGNMLEYLEAKYVQGVMVDASELDHQGGDEEEGDDHVGDDDEGAGSVYSDLSDFMDDTDLRRTVASQVLAHSTATRLELSRNGPGTGTGSGNNNQKNGQRNSHDDDNAFFVNVGALEVEETEFTQEHYDPLQDVDDSGKKKKAKATKKRKKPDSAATTITTTTSAPGKKSAPMGSSGSKPSSTSKAVVQQPKKKAKTGDTKVATAKGPGKPVSTLTKAVPKVPSMSKSLPAKPLVKAKTMVKAKAKVSPPAMTTASDDDENDDGASMSTTATPKAAAPTSSHAAVSSREVAALKATALQRKQVSDGIYDRILQYIPNEQFPRRKTKERVALICPADKKPGDSILFSNPHVPGQRLKVQIPKNTAAGGSFKVTVPVQEDLDETADYNKLSREFYDAVDDYARAYDDWCDAHGAWRKAVGDADWAPHLEKRKKFDALMKQFPNDLKTPVDKDYMKKILRRARQNRSKREQTALRHQDKSVGGSSVGGSIREEEEDDDAPPPAPTSSSSSPAAGVAKGKVKSAPRPSPPLPVGSRPAESKPSARRPSASSVDGSPATVGDPPVKTKPVTVPSLARSFDRVLFALKDFD